VTPDEPVFREVTTKEIPDLLTLWVESWSEVYPDIDFNGRRQWFSDHMDVWLAEGGVRIGAFNTTNQTLRGFILHKTATGHLDQFCVRSRDKGRGMARLLMAEVRRLSPQGITLEVNAMNTRAIRFYEREGFLKTGEGINPRSGLPTLRYRWQP
jgi:putative acetyltransferase